MATAAETQQRHQEALLGLLVAALRHAFALLDPGNLKTSLPEFKVAVAALIQQYGRASATVAAEFYRAERRAAGVPGTFTVRPATPAPLVQVEAALDWATKGLWNQQPDVRAAETQVEGVAEKLVLDTSRDTLLAAVKADRRAHGWARVPEAGACSFCLLLATRGAVYKTEQTADFRAHDHCKCHVEPLFAGHYEPTAQVREAQALYAESTRGLSGAEARKAFRQAVEGRLPTPPPPGAEAAHNAQEAFA